MSTEHVKRTLEQPEGPVRKLQWGARRLADGTRLFWWRELLIAYAFYSVYSSIRGHATGSADRAFRHAQWIIDWERHLGIYHELSIQQIVLHAKPLVVGLNYFYGLFHFFITIGVLVWLYRRHTNDYPFWRNFMAFTIGLALAGYFLFPLMPPRLLDSYPLNWELQFRFEDTLALYPNAWSFTTPPMKWVSNPYAAMPSLHFGWALYCGLAIVDHTRSRLGRRLGIAYPCAMLFAIVATGNHYILDAAGGAIVIGAAYLLARRFTRAGNVPGRRVATRATASELLPA